LVLIAQNATENNVHMVPLPIILEKQADLVAIGMPAHNLQIQLAEHSHYQLAVMHK
jgi:hypothetical protein